MTKLQKTGLYVAIISAILWLVWLCVWLYSDFGNGVGIYDEGGWLINWSVNLPNYLIYFALITAFAVWIWIILLAYLKKSSKKSLVVLILSSLIWFVCRICGYKFFNPDFCDCNHDYIGIALWIFSLSFFILWCISLFYVVRFSTNSSKYWVIILSLILAFLVVLSLKSHAECMNLPSPWFTSQDCWGGVFKFVFLVLLIISVSICVMAWIRRYKEAKKSS